MTFQDVSEGFWEVLAGLFPGVFGVFWVRYGPKRFQGVFGGNSGRFRGFLMDLEGATEAFSKDSEVLMYMSRGQRQFPLLFEAISVFQYS